MLNLERHWYRSSLSSLSCLLLPFSWVFRFIVWLRRTLYAVGIKKIIRFPVPIIVVGNITVGGTGKTPTVVGLVDFLKNQGLQPGIVSRGCGGKQQARPIWVHADSDPVIVGDEAVLLAECCQCPVVISIDRVAAVRMLLQNSACNIVLSDDGLQHYRLGRDLEICIVDGMRQFGNQQLLPAGPLRESVKRLQQIPFVLVNGENLQIKPQKIISLLKPQQITDFDHFQGVKVHAVAAIGHPQRFFALLRAQGLDIIEHIFPDHYLYSANDIIFADEFPVIMTEKDAIKCRKFADARHWYVAIHAVVEPQILEKINNRIKNLRSAYAIH